MTTQELSKQFYEKQHELEHTSSNLSAVRWNSSWINGVLIGLAVGDLTTHGKYPVVFYAFLLVFIIASLLCSYLEVRWEKKIKRLKDKQIRLIDKAINQEDGENAN